MNIKISSKLYHYHSKEGVRKIKAERLTRVFTYDETCDRNQVAAIIGEMPSPCGTTWHLYIKHKLRMMENGIEAYTTSSYARLKLDKHMEWHRAIDKMAGKLVNNKPAIIFLGNGSTAANSPISIKKHVRCPGTRKLIEAFKKRINCVVVSTNEYNTSQLCGRCFGRFPRWTKPKRYKKCDNCQPNPILGLPTRIITNVSKRALQMRRTIMKTWREMMEIGNEVAAILTQSKTGRLVSKKELFLKTWQPNANVDDGTDAEQPQQQRRLKTVWHRDISAAKLILYKGM